MENARKNSGLTELSDDARRQYVDARSAYAAWEEARKAAAEVRGGMYWKTQGKTDYLIRTSEKNSQKSLGPRSPETEAMHTKFLARKSAAEQRLAELKATLERHQRMNRALYVGRVPQILVDILQAIDAAGLSEFFTVVGTHALYAYEAATGGA